MSDPVNTHICTFSVKELKYQPEHVMAWLHLRVSMLMIQDELPNERFQLSVQPVESVQQRNNQAAAMQFAYDIHHMSGNEMCACYGYSMGDLYEGIHIIEVGEVMSYVMQRPRNGLDQERIDYLLDRAHWRVQNGSEGTR